MMTELKCRVCGTPDRCPDYVPKVGKIRYYVCPIKFFPYSPWIRVPKFVFDKLRNVKWISTFEDSTINR